MKLANSFNRDDRAIEGLPIRLVIALVIGVAALGIMMAMLSAGFTDFGDTEVTLEIDDTDHEIIEVGSTEEVFVNLYTEDGDALEGGTVILSGDGARIAESSFQESVGSCSACDDNQVMFDMSDVEPDLRTDQTTGELQFQIVPPSDSNYEDASPNPTITVVQD